jgi:branched-chain amino acid transport system substrate-binding protein
MWEEPRKLAQHAAPESRRKLRSIMKSRYLLAAGVLTVAMALILTACSSSSATPTSANASAGSGKSPIQIALLGDITAPSLGGGSPETGQGATAAVNAVNKAGGINGRKLELTICNTEGDPNTVLACARQVAGNKNIVAVVGSSTVVGNPESVLQDAGLAYFGEFPLPGTDTSSTISFPVIGGPVVEIECAVSLTAQRIKARKMTVAYEDVPAAAAVLPLISSLAGAEHVQVLRKVGLPATATDLSPQVATADSGVGATMLATNPQQEQQFILADKSSGSTVPLVAGDNLAPSSIKAMGSAANGVYECDALRPVSTAFAGGRQFLAETSYLGKGFAVDDTSTNAWLAVHMFANILKTMPTITRQSVLAKLRNLHNVSAYGFTTPLTTASTYRGLGGQFPRLFSRTAYAEKIENGKTVELPNGEGHF